MDDAFAWTRRSALKGPKEIVRILIGEETVSTESRTVRLLREGGAEVYFAHDGRECVDIALQAKEEGRPFDIIVLDVHLPTLDGYSAAMLLRENGCNRVIVSVTDKEMFSAEADSAQAGCDFHMEKGDVFQRLFPIIESCR